MIVLRKCVVKLLETLSFDVNLSECVGKDVVMYDEHHGSTRLVKDASLEKLEELYDEYTVVIVIS